MKSPLKRESLNSNGNPLKLRTAAFRTNAATALPGQGVAWNPALGGFIAAPRHRLQALLTLHVTTAGGTQAGPGLEWDGSEYSGSVRFRAVGRVSHVGLTGYLGLFDVTNNVYITGTTLTVTGTSWLMAESALLSLGNSLGAIHTYSTIYETRAWVQGGAGTSSATFGSAFLIFR